jgi:trehalose 6-phosphate synthase
MQRLVVVSNRVADLDAKGEASSGGLAMAMSAALREHGGLWFGWSGKTSEAATPVPVVADHGNVQTALLDLDQQAVDEYYNGFANRTLWPLCHQRIDLVSYERSFSAAYAQVNACFAAALAPLLRDDDVIWVHDYHLIPLARELRKLGVRNRIGFFLHIPWPAAQILATLPRHHELVQSLFDYDLLGFQSRDWLRAFQDYVVTELNGSIDAETVTAFGCTAVAKAYPIGLDMNEMRTLASSRAAQDSFETIRESAKGQQMLLGVDRIDYTKGLPEKFAAYAQFLQDNRDRAEQVFLLQIGQPSRTDVLDYKALNEELQAEAGRINGEFGTIGWSPLRYRNQSVPRDALAGVYRAARAAIVTPLRDGMNLVAKEYVASQDSEDPGVLILSRFAGAAAQMREALIVNPYSREDVADAIRRALDLPRNERIARWKALFAGLQRNDLADWRETFLHDLAGDRLASAGPTRVSR